MVLTHSRLLCVLCSGDARRPSTLHIVVIVIIMTTILNILMSPVTEVLHCAELFLNMWFCHGLCRETAKCRFNEQKKIECTKFEKKTFTPEFNFRCRQLSQLPTFHRPDCPARISLKIVPSNRVGAKTTQSLVTALSETRHCSTEAL